MAPDRVTNRLGAVEGLGDFGGVREQVMGGFMVFCIWGLWTARDHLQNVFRHTFARGPKMDDRSELMSYRAAVFLFLGAAGYMMFWLTRGGFNPVLSLLVVAFWFVFYVGFAKVIAMTGLVFTQSPSQGWDVLKLAPPDALGPGSIAIRQLIRSCTQNGKCFTMPSSTYAARLAEPLAGKARAVGRTAMAAFLLSLVAAAVGTIWVGYQDGAFNFGTYMFRNAAPRYYNEIVAAIRDTGQETHYGTPLAFTAWGAIVMAVMTFCQYRFAWWPVHPIGYTLVPFYSTRSAIVSIFLACLAKAVILRIGGISLYRRGMPLMIGCIVGYTFGLTVSMVVDLIWFPGRGHNLFWGD